jgi:uncharacterized membrane protein
MNPILRYPLVYGACSGVAVIAVIIWGLALADKFSGFASLWFGYLVMLLALTFIFVGVKRYRDQEKGGVIRFLPAFGMGLAIGVVASIAYMLAWEVYLAATGYRFMDEYVASTIRARHAAGVPAAKIAAEAVQLEAMRVSYQSPLVRLPMTFMEIFPVALIVSLISAGLLRNPRILPAR